MSDLNSYEESLAIDLAKAEARIEQLERERDEWIAHAKNAIWSDSEELKLSETKLAKAMEALREIAGSSPEAETWYIALVALAELEGKE